MILEQDAAARQKVACAEALEVAETLRLAHADYVRQSEERREIYHQEQEQFVARLREEEHRLQQQVQQGRSEIQEMSEVLAHKDEEHSLVDKLKEEEHRLQQHVQQGRSEIQEMSEVLARKDQEPSLVDKLREEEHRLQQQVQQGRSEIQEMSELLARKDQEHSLVDKLREEEHRLQQQVQQGRSEIQEMSEVLARKDQEHSLVDRLREEEHQLQQQVQQGRSEIQEMSELLAHKDQEHSLVDRLREEEHRLQQQVQQGRSEIQEMSEVLARKDQEHSLVDKLREEEYLLQQQVEEGRAEIQTLLRFNERSEEAQERSQSEIATLKGHLSCFQSENGMLQDLREQNLQLQLSVEKWKQEAAQERDRHAQMNLQLGDVQSNRLLEIRCAELEKDVENLRGSDEAKERLFLKERQRYQEELQEMRQEVESLKIKSEVRSTMPPTVREERAKVTPAPIENPLEKWMTNILQTGPTIPQSQPTQRPQPVVQEERHSLSIHSQLKHGDFNPIRPIKPEPDIIQPPALHASVPFGRPGDALGPTVTQLPRRPWEFGREMSDVSASGSRVMDESSGNVVLNMGRLQHLPQQAHFSSCLSSGPVSPKASYYTHGYVEPDLPPPRRSAPASEEMPRQMMPVMPSKGGNFTLSVPLAYDFSLY